ncbi:MAG: ROK family protein, partial [Micromonosporaceae bacterium]
AAEHVDSSLLFTVGTGIGGAVVLGGELVRGGHGIAAEFGHMLAVPDGQLCGCGRRGCLEQYASGNALVREARRRASATPDAAAELLRLTDGDLLRIDGPVVTQAAQAGDEAAREAFAEVGHWLGIGMANLVQVLDPDMIVVGGGVIDAGELLLGPARKSCAAALAQRSRLPYAAIQAAQMGPHAGVVGAADLARKR